MKISNFLIVIIWLFFLRDAYLQGRNIPTTTLLENAPTETVILILTLPFLFFLTAGFFQRKSLIEIPMLTKYIDKKYGNGTFQAFVSKLRPITLFTLGCLLLGITGLVSTYLSTKNPSGYLVGGFFISGGIGLLIAFLLSIRFPPRLL